MKTPISCSLLIVLTLLGRGESRRGEGSSQTAPPTQAKGLLRVFWGPGSVESWTSAWIHGVSSSTTASPEEELCPAPAPRSSKERMKIWRLVPYRPKTKEGGGGGELSAELDVVAGANAPKPQAVTVTVWGSSKRRDVVVRAPFPGFLVNGTYLGAVRSEGGRVQTVWLVKQRDRSSIDLVTSLSLGGGGPKGAGGGFTKSKTTTKPVHLEHNGEDPTTKPVHLEHTDENPTTSKSETAFKESGMDKYDDFPFSTTPRKWQCMSTSTVVPDMDVLWGPLPGKDPPVYWSNESPQRPKPSSTSARTTGATTAKGTTRGSAEGASEKGGFPEKGFLDKVFTDKEPMTERPPSTEKHLSQRPESTEAKEEETTPLEKATTEAPTSTRRPTAAPTTDTTVAPTTTVTEKVLSTTDDSKEVQEESLPSGEEGKPTQEGEEEEDQDRPEEESSEKESQTEESTKQEEEDEEEEELAKEDEEEATTPSEVPPTTAATQSATVAGNTKRAHADPPLALEFSPARGAGGGVASAQPRGLLMSSSTIVYVLVNDSVRLVKASNLAQ